MSTQVLRFSLGIRPCSNEVRILFRLLPLELEKQMFPLCESATTERLNTRLASGYQLLACQSSMAGTRKSWGVLQALKRGVWARGESRGWR